MQGIYLKVLLYANFFRATFFVFCEPLNSQQGLAKPPPENKWAFRTYVHYAPLMMSQKESPRNHPWVLPGWFLEKYTKWFEFPLNKCFLLKGRAGQSRSGIVIGITQDLSIVFSSQSVVSLPCLVNSRRNHPSLTINLESGTHTKLATLLGSTHGWFLGDSFCYIINGV